MSFSRRILLRCLAAGALVGTAFPALNEPSDADPPVGPIRLDKNENAYGPSPKAVEAMRASVDLANRYPSGEYELLTEKIAMIHGIKADRVTLGAGSREVLRMAMAAYLPPRKKLVLASPTFDAVHQIAQVAGVVEIVPVPLNNRFAHDLGAMLARTDASAGLIYICNPNNPTGTLTRRQDLEAFLSKLPTTATVVIDEAYHEYVGASSDYASFIDRPVDDDRVIVIRSFSKIYGLAGLRLGYGVSSPSRARSLSASRLPWGVSTTAARAAAAALDDTGYVQLCAKRNTDDRQEFYNQVNARMFRGIDSQTNFVMLKSGLPPQQIIEHFKKNNVLLGPLIPAMPKFVRCSLGTSEQMQEFWRVWDLLPAHPMTM